MTDNAMFTVEKKACVGCGACMQHCPTSSIKMNKDEEGFWYPQINEKLCINCGQCMQVCPVYVRELKEPRSAYAALNTNKQVAKKSSSGGIFPLLATSWIQSGGSVCGVIMNNDCQVCHVIINDVSEIETMQGSKYVQSKMHSCMADIENSLKNGKRVLFLGHHVK